MPNTKNTETVQKLREKISKSKSVVLTDYKGLSVNAINELRGKISETDSDVMVAKNTLLKIALEEEKLETDKLGDLKGQTMTVFAYADPVSPIKVIADFAKTSELPKFKAAFIERVYTTADQLSILSTLPSREQLLAQVVWGLKSPINGIVNVLSGTQRKLVTVLSEVAKKK
ncbi:MAG: 50S ribosomal protein L10 [Patescibacteria group bacterium]|jgi:large subunit ribosomal protein L10